MKYNREYSVRIKCVIDRLPRPLNGVDETHRDARSNAINSIVESNIRRTLCEWNRKPSWIRFKNKYININKNGIGFQMGHKHVKECVRKKCCDKSSSDFYVGCVSTAIEMNWRCWIFSLCIFHRWIHVAITIHYNCVCALCPRINSYFFVAIRQLHCHSIYIFSANKLHAHF